MNDPHERPSPPPPTEAAEPLRPAPPTHPPAQPGDSADVLLRQWEGQPPGVDVSSSAVLARLLRAARLAEDLFVERLRRQPGPALTNVGDFDLLRTLRRAAPGNALTPGQLMRSLVISSAGLSGRLNRLERDGWIVRTASPDDRRRSLVTLTQQGRREFDRRLESHLAVERQLLSVLSPEERGAVVTALRKLLLALETAE
ncbi:MarR family winged helix-turn-helix transcriptional regulator [Streptomyces sp. NPDC090994]|uniref:MarR family winged helix-turn-helix transcriptional regulator n=1 Tax=Streptomyces sp. NPDC090994 TaxID=3365969 RepID=UPI0037F873CB